MFGSSFNAVVVFALAAAGMVAAADGSPFWGNKPNFAIGDENAPIYSGRHHHHKPQPSQAPTNCKWTCPAVSDGDNLNLQSNRGPFTTVDSFYCLYGGLHFCEYNGLTGAPADDTDNDSNCPAHTEGGC